MYFTPCKLLSRQKEEDSKFTLFFDGMFGHAGFFMVAGEEMVLCCPLTCARYLSQINCCSRNRMQIMTPRAKYQYISDDCWFISKKYCAPSSPVTSFWERLLLFNCLQFPSGELPLSLSLNEAGPGGREKHVFSTTRRINKAIV